ncbi:hypothetical protein AB0N29_09975 [Nocardioides sp. NPDC092400]|uniref:hypothetical protein n=1 Tax=Nocardioides sp. NPDC092400 TaxID=3155196 RepID=UPI0034474C54
MGERAERLLLTVLVVSSLVVLVGQVQDGDVLRAVAWAAVAVFWLVLAVRRWRAPGPAGRAE